MGKNIYLYCPNPASIWLKTIDNSEALQIFKFPNSKIQKIPSLAIILNSSILLIQTSESELTALTLSGTGELKNSKIFKKLPMFSKVQTFGLENDHIALTNENFEKISIFKFEDNGLNLLLKEEFETGLAGIVDMTICPKGQYFFVLGKDKENSNKILKVFLLTKNWDFEYLANCELDFDEVNSMDVAGYYGKQVVLAVLSHFSFVQVMAFDVEKGEIKDFSDEVMPGGKDEETRLSLRQDGEYAYVLKNGNIMFCQIN